MKLVNVSEKGTLKFELSDGRFLHNYTSGYVRIEYGGDRLYQINKVRKIVTESTYFYKRILIPNASDRYQYCVEWVKRNVK
jgi:hypothetical protein